MVEVIKATPEHPFFTTKGLVSAENLGIGTELVTRAGPSASHGSGLVVKAVTPIPATVGKDGKRAGFVVYNLEVEDDHTYFVGDTDGGVWVHNACALSSLITRRGIRNSGLTVSGAGHPVTGVPFPNFEPDFSGHLYSGGPNTVSIQYTGSYSQDFAAADAAAGYASTPTGYTWHHMQDMTTIQLVDKATHGLTGHTGGVSFWEAIFRTPYRP